LRRRQFLKYSAAGAAAAFVSGPSLFGRSARAFGEFPTGAASAMLPAEAQAQSVLEVFLYGGLSPWETLYTVEEYGKPTDPSFPNEQYYAFQGGGSDSIDAALSACQFPSGTPLTESFATDANGADVKLGPFALKLRERPDITSRMRILVQKHALEPHEAAVPQALTGKPVGQPSAAGLGSHIQRYFVDRASSDRAAPFSYIFAVGGIAGDNVSAASATGAHPGFARPLKITITNVDRLAELLDRGEIGSVAARGRYDQLMDVYVDQYKRRLEFNGDEERLVRSSRFADLSQAVESMGDVDAIKAVMPASLFVDVPGASCGDTRSFDIPGMSLNAARHLLTHPDQPASYVCVSDIGLYEASGGGGYDTHSDNSFDTARNFNNLLKNLTAVINQPGENDPDKIDLDKTLVILNTEFGRSPTPQNGGSGRNHHPHGYVTAMFGGPIGSSEKGVYGAIGPDSIADTYITPAENRIAAMLALGIWPFSPEAFAVSDVPGAVSEENAAKIVTERVLGIVL